MAPSVLPTHGGRKQKNETVRMDAVAGEGQPAERRQETCRMDLGNAHTRTEWVGRRLQGSQRQGWRRFTDD